MKRRNVKIALSLILCISMLLGISLPAFAKETSSNRYPFIYVHGMMGWGEGTAFEEETPYWGTQPENNVMTYLRDKGYEVYNPPVGGLGSAWDRACELYAQLTGTVVDYGEAHSKKCGHERYGRDYTGRATMGKAWDMEMPLNLVGHSFGGATVRLFASLVAYGDEEERNVSGGNCSGLFKGGHESAIYSVTSLAAPHNGSTVANYISDPVVPAVFVALMTQASINLGLLNMDLIFDQWGISADPATGEQPKLSLRKCIKAAASKDNCAYDMTVQGAEELNEKIKTVKTAYYFSYSTCITETDKRGYTKVNEDYDNIFTLFKATSVIISGSVNVFLGGKFIDKSWGANDGIVPLKSALYPSNADHITYSEGITLQPGVWYVMPTIMGADHYDFCTAADTGEMGTKEEYFGFYTKHMEMIYSA